MPKPRLLSKARYAIEDAAYRISEAGRRAKAKRKIRKLDRQNNLHGENRRIVKMRPWLKRRGKNKHGYSRVKLLREKGETVVMIPAGGKEHRKVAVRMDARTEGEITEHVFYNAEENRIIVVTRDEFEETQQAGEKRLEIEFCAYSGELEGDAFHATRSNRFLRASEHLLLKKGVRIGGGFAWLGEEGTKIWGETRPPKFIEEKGFGLFVDFLRDAESRKKGTKKSYAQIFTGEDSSRSKRFAERRGYRTPTREEERRYYELVANNRAMPQHTLMVRDL